MGFHPAVIQPEPRPDRNPTTSQSVSANRFLAAILTRLRLLCRAETRWSLQSFALRSRNPGLAKERSERFLRKRRSPEPLAFGASYLKPGNGSLRYSCPFLLSECRKHRNHHILERSGRVQPLLLIGNVTHAFRLKPLYLSDDGRRRFFDFACLVIPVLSRQWAHR